MEKFACSCDTAEEYPRNLLYHNTYEHNLMAYFVRLKEQEKRLFRDELKACLDFWEFDDGAQEFRRYSAHNEAEVKKQHTGASLLGCIDPRCRFVFVHAPHSRERLNTSRKMLMFTLTYHQVMPAFLDFLFPFGRQQYAQDFHFSGFRHESRLTDAERGLRAPELGRSGRDLRMCYSLKSVEPSKGQQDWPWSVRQTAIYHSFDIETGKAIWIVVKGDQLMKNRVESATGSGGLPELGSFGSKDRAFTSTLATHLIFCDWAGENWRWYINFLDDALQERTRRTLIARVDKVSSPVSEKTRFRSTDLSTPQSSNYPPSPPCPPGPPRPPRLPHCPKDQCTIDEPEEFSFNDLQRIQFIEDKANETLLVLKANMNIMAELKQHYRSLLDSDFTSELGRDYCRVIPRFEKRIGSVENDLRTQQSRVETLLRFLADRKSLLYGILEYRNMEANKQLAKKAQQSADNMEVMTRNMYVIAQKTKQETVSMRIITLVTLFFLPGTFISTLMSTDIIKFQPAGTGKPEKTFQPGALQLYMAISVPLMLLTFAAWYGVYWWVNRKSKEMKWKGGLFPLQA